MYGEIRAVGNGEEEGGVRRGSERREWAQKRRKETRGYKRTG